MASDHGRVIFGSRKKIAISILHGSGARSNTRLDTHCERAMATPEQIAAKVQATMANTTTTMTASVEASLSRMLEDLTSRIAANINTGGGGTTGNGGFGPSGKIFRDIGKFGGEEGAWAEWALKFRIKYDVVLFQALEMAGDSEVEINMIEVAQSNSMDRCMEKSAMLYNRFVHLLSGRALTLHQSVVGENGLEVWRLLKKRYDPKTTLRNLQQKVAGLPCPSQSLGGMGQHVEA